MEENYEDHYDHDYDEDFDEPEKYLTVGEMMLQEIDWDDYPDENFRSIDDRD